MEQFYRDFEHLRDHFYSSFFFPCSVLSQFLTRVEDDDDEAVM